MAGRLLKRWSDKMKNRIAFLISWILIFSSFVNADQNKGPETIVLDGGSKGKVTLPHLTHQNTLKDCNACHTVFPQKTGSIQSLKSEGKLGKKSVMNKLCIACHRAEKKAGKPSGPVSCFDCHGNKPL
jgi:cytochrome c-type protein NrfB